MIEIRPLENITAADLIPLTGPYLCKDTFQVTYTEDELGTRFTLELVPLAQPVERSYDHIDEEWVQQYLRPADFAFGAYDGGRLVGALFAEKRDWNSSMWVWDFHVELAHRRQGIGRLLMEHAAEKAQAAGLRVIVCETQNRNSNAIKAYRKLGFHLEGIDISYYTNHDFPDQDIAVFMKRRLDPA
jgi:streptothricin acetyltransferase